MQFGIERSLALLLAGLCLLGGGCDSFFGDDRPETARLVLDAAPGTRVQLVTSTTFDVLQRGPTGPLAGVSISDADTAQVTLPFEQSFDIRAGARFFAYVSRADSGDGAIHMRGFIDGDERYDATHPDSLRFVYFYQGYNY